MSSVKCTVLFFIFLFGIASQLQAKSITINFNLKNKTEFDMMHGTMKAEVTTKNGFYKVFPILVEKEIVRTGTGVFKTVVKIPKAKQGKSRFGKSSKTAKFCVTAMPGWTFKENVTEFKANLTALNNKCFKFNPRQKLVNFHHTYRGFDQFKRVKDRVGRLGLIVIGAVANFYESVGRHVGHVLGGNKSLTKVRKVFT